MKPILWKVGILFLLCACQVDMKDPPVNEPLPGNPEPEPAVYPFSLSFKTLNACGIELPSTNYEVVHYHADGSINARYAPDAAGMVLARLPSATETLAVIEPQPTGLAVTVLQDQPVQDWGTWYRTTNATQGCECETYRVSISTPAIDEAQMNLPHQQNSEPNPASFEQTLVCHQPNEVEPLLVVNGVDKSTGQLKFSTTDTVQGSANQQTLDVALIQTGEAVTIDVDDPIHAKAGQFHYVTDGRFFLSSNFGNVAEASRIQHARVAPLKYVSTLQVGIPYPVYKWEVHIPLNNDTSLIRYEAPTIDKEQMIAVIDGDRDNYKFDASLKQDLALFRATIARKINSETTLDRWLFVMPVVGELPASFDLPEEYAAHHLQAGSVFYKAETFSLVNVLNMDSADVTTTPSLVNQLLNNQRPNQALTHQYEKHNVTNSYRIN